MVTKQLRFNISPSCMGSYADSQLMFFFQYILKKKADSEPITCYGLAGNIVHNLLEDYQNGTIGDTEIDMEFLQQWRTQNLPTLPAIRGFPLDSDPYQKALWCGMETIDRLKKETTELKAEENISFPLYNTPEIQINFKGKIDVNYKENGDLVILDWKTSNSIDSSKKFQVQGMFYAYLLYKKHGAIPLRAIFDYCKIGKTKTFFFVEDMSVKPEGYKRGDKKIHIDEIKNFERDMIKPFAEEIIKKGFDISKYEIGAITSPFNQHLQSCREESYRRQNMDTITLSIEDNLIKFNEGVSKDFMAFITKKYRYITQDYNKNDRCYVKKIHYMVKNNTLPYPLINDLLKTVIYFNNKFDTNFVVQINDKRNKTILNKVYSTKFGKSDIELRDYQKDAIKKVLEEKRGIWNVGTGLGKTQQTVEFIRKTNRRTLFLVNRQELVDQTKQVYEDSLDVDIGTIAESKMDTSKQITIGAIQTIFAILKRDNHESKQLLLYLANVTVMIYDECQTVSEAKSYDVMRSCLSNCEYFLGLSGSPFRNDGSTLGMYGLTGPIIFTKTTEEGIKEGYLVPVKCLFVENPSNCYTDEEGLPVQDNGRISPTKLYQQTYKTAVVDNDNRNMTIIGAVEFFRKKDKKIIIATSRTEHGKYLHDSIENSILITGDTPRKERKELYKKFKKSRDVVLIGNYKIFSAGIDIPDLDVVINVVGNKSLTDVIQMVGRPMRKHPGKTCGYYLDFLDIGNKYLDKSAIERIKILKQYKNEVKLIDPKTFGLF
jgi:superfamily II DNA or RNA helicase